MSCNYTFNMPDGTEVTVDEKTFKQMQASGQLSHVTSIKTDGTLASIERAHEQAMAAQTNRSLRQSAGAFFSNQATRYIDKYFNVDKWIDTIKGIDEVGKMSLKTALSRVTTMANFSEKQINARGQEAADFAKRADVKGVDQDEKKVAVFSNWAQLSTIEDATKRLILQMMPDTKGPTAQKENIIGIALSSFVEAANAVGNINPTVGNITDKARKDLLVQSLNKFDDKLTITDATTFDEIAAALGVPVGDIKRLPGGYLVKDAKQFMLDMESKYGVENKTFEEFYVKLNTIVKDANETALAQGRISQQDYDDFAKGRYLPLYVGERQDDTRLDPDLYDGFKLNNAGGFLRSAKTYAQGGYDVSDPNNSASPMSAFVATVRYGKLMGKAAANNNFLQRIFKLHMTEVGQDGVSSFDTRVRRLAPNTGGGQLGDREYIVYAETPTGKVVQYAIKMPEIVDTAFQIVDKPPSAMGVMTKGVGKLVTRYVPSFALANSLWSDPIARAIYLFTNEKVQARDAKGDPIRLGRADIVAGMAKSAFMLPKAAKAGWMLESGTLLTTPDDQLNDVEKDLKELAQSGSLTGLGDVIKIMNRNADQIVEDVIGKKLLGSKKARFIDDRVMRLNSAAETLAPLATYRTVRDAVLNKGGTEQEAKQAGQSAVLESLNYARKGSDAGAISSQYLFFIPAMTETKSLIGGFKRNPARATELTIWLALGAAMLYSMAAGESEDEVLGNELDRRPLSDLETGIPFQGGRIPVPFGLPRAIWMLTNIQRRHEHGHFDSKEAVYSAIRSVIKSTSPISAGEQAVENDPFALLVTTIAPTIFRGLTFAAFDRTAFGGAVPGRTNTGEPKYMQGSRSTPQGYKDFSKMTYDTIGLDVYPEAWKTLLESYFVGPFSILPRIMKQNAKEMTGKELTPKDDPITGFLFGRFMDARTREQAVDAAFYDNLNKYKKIYAEKFRIDKESGQLVPRPTASPDAWEAYAAEWSRAWESHKKNDNTATWALGAAQKADYLATLTPPEREKLKSIMPELQKRANAEKESFLMMSKRIEQMRLDQP